MAVYTEVGDEDLAQFVAQYDIGQVTSCKGIAEGVENSNYLLRTERGSFILTLYEKRVKAEDLPFFLGLMDHLAAGGFACPTPVHARDGKALRTLCGRPAAIVTFLDGMWPRQIQPQHCKLLGEAMARMHLAGASFAVKRANALGLGGWRPLVDACAPRAGEVRAGLDALIRDEIAYLEPNWPKTLPEGVIHADLFQDNVLFLGDKLSGVIDFYFACNDFFAYEIAICLNAWCFERDGDFNATKARLMLQSYRAVRPIQPQEIAA
ncbi:MAG: homoserine kinase, partial [Alphaproteobacteria bacterium]|nr:homoserine kinase [Alphaproteobacteria bacterium]